MLDFQVSTIVFTVINLLVLYFILRKLLFGRVNAVLEQRAARVKETIDSAEASKSQAEELRAEYEDKLTDARQEAAKLVADAQNRAQRAYEAKMADAETDAKRLRSEAEAQIASERDAMLRGARNEVASLALLAAGGFYMVCIYSFGTILDWHEFVKSPVPALACLKGINMLLYLAMLVIATLGPMGPMNSFYGATSRIMLAMGRKGQLPEKFAEVDPKSGAPKLACVVLGVITVVGPFLGKNMLIPLTNVSALAFIFSCGMVALACLRMRFTEPDLPRPYEVPGGKFGIGLAIAACAIIIGLLVIPFSPASLNMVEWSIVIGWLAIGLALMAFTNSRKK